MEDKYNGKRKKRESIFLFGDSEGDNRQIEENFRRSEKWVYFRFEKKNSKENTTRNPHLDIH